MCWPTVAGVDALTKEFNGEHVSQHEYSYFKRQSEENGCCFFSNKLNE